ncbi:COP9 signalosome complex subunit 6, partial [Clonorchis sinensis]
TMEVDSLTDSGPVASGSGSICVRLHPLVVLNISEHWTRNKVKENSPAVVVYGALLGKQEGHYVEITNSFELLLDEEPHMAVNADFYGTRESQCKQVYPDLDIVGWYTTGGPITEHDELFNRQVDIAFSNLDSFIQMQELNESLIILKLDPLHSCGEQLPVRIYESVVDNDGRIHFRQVLYTLATDEAERIGVDYVARISMTSTGQTSSMTAEHLLGNYQATQMLYNRLSLIRAYVSAVAAGELPVNRARLREINALTKRLSLLSSATGVGDRPSEIKEHLYRQANDVCLASLLASLTQGLHTFYTSPSLNVYVHVILGVTPDQCSTSRVYLFAKTYGCFPWATLVGTEIQTTAVCFRYIAVATVATDKAGRFKTTEVDNCDLWCKLHWRYQLYDIYIVCFVIPFKGSHFGLSSHKNFVNVCQLTALNTKLSSSSFGSILVLVYKRKISNHGDFEERHKNPWTLMKIPRRCCVRQKAGGMYTHLGLKAGLLRQLREIHTRVTNIDIQMNVDGIQTYNNSRTQPFVIGINCGKNKLNDALQLMSDAVTELTDVLVNGVSGVYHIHTIRLAMDELRRYEEHLRDGPRYAQL